MTEEEHTDQPITNFISSSANGTCITNFQIVYLNGLLCSTENGVYPFPLVLNVNVVALEEQIII